MDFNKEEENLNISVYIDRVYEKPEGYYEFVGQISLMSNYKHFSMFGNKPKGIEEKICCTNYLTTIETNNIPNRKIKKWKRIIFLDH